MEGRTDIVRKDERMDEWADIVRTDTRTNSDDIGIALGLYFFCILER